jgi:hypothetical protein
LAPDGHCKKKTKEKKKKKKDTNLLFSFSNKDDNNDYRFILGFFLFPLWTVGICFLFSTHSVRRRAGIASLIMTIFVILQWLLTLYLRPNQVVWAIAIVYILSFTTGIVMMIILSKKMQKKRMKRREERKRLRQNLLQPSTFSMLPFNEDGIHPLARLQEPPPPPAPTPAPKLHPKSPQNLPKV